MNIYAVSGDKVVFAYPDNGSDCDREKALSYLTPNERYTIDRTRVGSFSTKIFLQEVHGVPFNSVMFEDAEITEGKISEELSTPHEYYRITRLQALKECDPSHIDAYQVMEGYFLDKFPEIGNNIVMQVEVVNGERLTTNKLLTTTNIVKTENHFYYTQNSIYKIEKL